MERMQRSRWSAGSRIRGLSAAGVSLLFLLMFSGTALGQQVAVTGTVTTAGGSPLRGVTVRVQGSDVHVFTNANGKYAIAAPTNGTLLYTIIGQREASQPVNGRTTIDVSMQPIAFLDEVVVTAYSEEQRRADITGAVASVNLASVDRQTSASVLQRLDANVTGVTVDASGSPGSRSTVRVRGISSFQNNDPLYVVDGTPVQDSYINFLNPNDIASVQVLKDASSASIYGSRASNGVIIIETTKRGAAGAPKVNFSARSGINTPVHALDDLVLTDALAYFQVVKTAYQNAGLAVPTNIYGSVTNPSVPAFIYPNACTPAPCTNVDVSTYSYPNNLIMRGSAGTDWWKAVFHAAPIQDYNLGVTGGGSDNTYALSFNYFNQDGTARYNYFRRGNIRANTSFTRDKFTFGENVALSLERHIGGMPDDPGGYAEDGIMGKNILMQPVIPIYDVGGHFASGKSTGLGNQSNPLKEAFEARNNTSNNGRIFGNVFGNLGLNDKLSVRTRLGFNVGQSEFNGFNPTFFENSEPSTTNSINENQNQFVDWTWSNTAKFDDHFSKHNISLLVGQEANQTWNRYLQCGMSSLINTSVDSRYCQDALGDAKSKTTFSSGGKSALLSFFGKADYNWDEKYVASVTLRQDGSSRLSPAHRWGTFPAFGLGWRVSKEGFLEGNHLLSDLMLRYGWGVTGNQQIPSGRIASQFGGNVGDTYYDISGSNSSVRAGFRQTALGNANLKWEEARTQNIGADMQLFDGKANVQIDVYDRKTNNLLFDPPIPGTAGVLAPPIVNIGKMENSGVDFSIGHQSATWGLTFNGSHYKNKIVSIDGQTDFFYGPISTRFGNQVINQVGHPIGCFYGYQADGFFKDAADVSSHATQDGAAPGRIKFRDVAGAANGGPDGRITLADRTIIGCPHPKFTAGLDGGYRWKSFDLNATLFGTFGNKIFDVQKEFYVFRNFSTNVRKDLLQNSWRPVDASLPRAQWTAANPGAKYPVLDQADTYSHAISSYYVEDGSYVRLRNIQIGYMVPTRFERFGLNATRIYVQAENLFTITGYEGLDPALPAANVFGSAGDIRDQYRGIDRGSYPSNRTFSIGLTTNF
jgi:TonB-dependent starch-binding outer membrane protein SusC